MRELTLFSPGLALGHGLGGDDHEYVYDHRANANAALDLLSPSSSMFGLSPGMGCTAEEPP